MNNSFNPDIDPALMVRFLSGEANEQEERLIKEWILADVKHQKYFEEVSALWNNSARAKDFSLIDTTEDWMKVRARIKFTNEEKQVQPLYKKNSWVSQILKIAAVFILFLGIILWANSSLRKSWFEKEIVYTANKQIRMFTLPDGTTVFLNKDSRLTYYPESFGEEKREVNVTGEAFFEVAKNKEKPFLVKSGPVVTQVIGTSFHVNALSEDSVTVTVLTGKVALFKEDNEQDKIIMIPGDKGAFLTGKLSKSVNKELNFMAWKTGVLTFQHTPLQAVIKDLNKYYNQKIRLESKALEACELTSTFNKQTLEAVLAELQLVLPVEIVKKDSILIISGEGC